MLRTIRISGLVFLAAALLPSQQEDPFAWLEEIEGAAPLDWVRTQNDRTLKELQVDARYQEIYREALEILTSRQRIPVGEIRGDYVYNFWQDERQVRGIWRRAPLDGYRAGSPKWETLLDVDALATAERQNWVFKSASCLAPAYERCLITVSRGGSDASVSREFSISKKAFIKDGFLVPEGKNRQAMLDDNTLLVASDWGEGRTASGYARAVRTWKRGAPFSAAQPLFQGESGDVSVYPYVLRHQGAAYPFVARAPTFFEVKTYWLKPDGQLALLPLPTLSTIFGVFHGQLIAGLEEPWTYASVTYPTGSIVALQLAGMTAEKVFSPDERQAVTGVAIGKSYVFAEILEDVKGKIKRFRREDGGWREEDLPLPPDSVVQIAAASGERDDLFVLHESLTTPQTLYHVSAGNQLSKAMSLPAFFDATEVVVEQRFATSKDGVKIPYFLMARKDALRKGKIPVVQYAYGGFLSPTLPVYYEDPSRPQHGALAGKLWVSRGGGLVLANIRGGGEYGPRWHQSALKANRQRAFDDFFAVSEDLIARGVTTPQKLGAMGRSNGGLLMGVALTQRPDLYAAIDCGVPLFDMQRYNKLLAGASWMAEYGNPDIAAEWAYIAKYSPYHNLKKGARYPKVFFYTSTKDDRVHPGHARKAAAKLASLGYDFYYYENMEGGHGGTTTQAQLAMRTALEYVYFARQLMGGSS